MDVLSPQQRKGTFTNFQFPMWLLRSPNAILISLLCIHPFFLLESCEISISGIMEFHNDVICEGPFTIIVWSTLVDILHLKTQVLQL